MNKSSVMRKAAAYRRQGYDNSTALKKAWNRNPVKTRSFTPSIVTLGLLAAVGWLVWFRSTKGRWPWSAA